MSSFNPLIRVTESSCQSWIWAAVRKRGGSLFSRPVSELLSVPTYCSIPTYCSRRNTHRVCLQSTGTDEADRRALTAQSCQAWKDVPSVLLSNWEALLPGGGLAINQIFRFLQIL